MYNNVKYHTVLATGQSMHKAALDGHQDAHRPHPCSESQLLALSLFPVIIQHVHHQKYSCITEFV